MPGPGTWVAGDVLTAADLNAIGTFSTYTATPKQSVTLTATATNLYYCKVNKLVIAQGRWAFTTAGTASNALLIDTTSLPAPAVAGVVGTFLFFDSGAQFYVGSVSMTAGGQLSFSSDGGNNSFGLGPAVTVANGDAIDINLSYRAA